MACFADFNVSEGSVATYARCGGIFDIHLLQIYEGFYWSKRQWVAVASAGPYASLHLAPDR